MTASQVVAAAATAAVAIGSTSFALAAAPADGGWPMAAHDYSNTRYSPLAEITAANIAKLRPAWTFSTSVDRGHEGVPIVADDTLFIVTPFPNRVIALDVSKPGATIKWTFDPKPDPGAQGVACCDAVNRGAVYNGGRLFFDTLDNQVIALDAANGKEIWRVRLGNFSSGQSMTMSPIVVKGQVLVGTSGAVFGVRGFIAAIDAGKGRETWRAWSTGPDEDVHIGQGFSPFYAADRGTDLGVSTWPPDAWKSGGGTVDGWLSYDAELDLVFHGTGRPAPRNPLQRPGANKWTSALFARRPATGDAVWAYQMSPNDRHGYDGSNENVLVELPLAGRQRKLMLHPDGNGHIYVIDRASGELLSADPFVFVSTSQGVDLASGALGYRAHQPPPAGRVVRDSCPGSAGAKNWQPGAWSPRTRLLYLPVQNLCDDTAFFAASQIAGTPYLGAEAKMHPHSGEPRGAFIAWDPIARRKVWSIAERFPVWSGALATAGDLVFYGTMDGWLKAVDARNGRELWKHKTISGIVGQPMSYRGGDGHQYIAVLAGVGGWAGLIVSNALDARDGTAAGGFVNAMKDLPKVTGKGGMLYVFRIP